VLVGLSGSGKSTVGRALAARLGRPFVDTDALIEERSRMQIPRLFEELGEPAFRAIEREAVADAVGRDASVVATGGGAPIDSENRRLLWDGNLVVWLDAPVEELVRRVGAAGDGRPLLAGGAAERLVALREARAPVYATAHLRVETEQIGVDGAVGVICERLEVAGS
jgi:shikimate kinase